MIAADQVAVILLAAGASSRFGTEDKLAASLDGLALGLHAAQTLGGLPFAAHIAVTQGQAWDLETCGFAPIVNTNSGEGQSGSLRLGLAEARRVRPRAVLVALADMPFVTAAHIHALLTEFDDEHPVVASSDGSRAGPPALFGVKMFDEIEALSGDTGARALLGAATMVFAAAQELADIDRPADLERLRAAR